MGRCREAAEGLCRAKAPKEPKKVVMQRTFREKREQAARNISSQPGVQPRARRSIQVEGAFALLKIWGFGAFSPAAKAIFARSCFPGV